MTEYISMKFSNFCNMCLNTNTRTISADDNTKIKNILLTCTGIAEILNNNTIYLCSVCCNKLEVYDEVKNMCYNNVIKFRKSYYKMKTKLELENDPHIEYKLQQFLEAKLQGECNSDLVKKYECLDDKLKNLRNNTSKKIYISEECILETAKSTRTEQTKLVNEKYFENISDSTTAKVKQETEEYTETEITEVNEENEPMNFEFVTCEKTLPTNKELNIKEEIIEDLTEDAICESELDQREDTNEYKPNLYVKKHACKYCNKVCLSRAHLIDHERIHTGEKPYKCSLCDKAFNLTSNLTRHLKIHAGKKPLKCADCGMVFNNSGTMIQHVRSHTLAEITTMAIHKRTHIIEKPYTCRICKKAFTQSSHAIKHELIHTIKKPFKCDICSKTFTHASNLKTHQRTHTGEKPYKCNVCQKTFAHSSTLSKHTRIHTGERCYSCSICKKAFKQSSHLIRHIRIHTRDQP